MEGVHKYKYKSYFDRKLKSWEPAITPKFKKIKNQTSTEELGNAVDTVSV